MGSLSFTLFVLVSLLVSFAGLYFLLFRRGAAGLSESGWAKLDLTGLVIGALSIVLGSGQYHSMVRANEEEMTRILIHDALYDIGREAGRLFDECGQPNPRCDLYNEISRAVRESEFRSGITPGEVHLDGRSYRSLNQLIVERSEALGADSLSITIIAPSTQVLDLSGDLNSRAFEDGGGGFPTWLAYLWPMLLSVAMSFSLVKAVRSLRSVPQAA